jgi:hypothetical protein
MKMKKIIAGIIILSILIPVVAAAPRTQPVSSKVFRETVLTTAQTELVIPNQHYAQHTWIVNRGAGTIYLKFEAGTIDTATDFYVLSGESLQNIDVPWRPMELLAVTQSADVEILVTY